MAPRNMMSRLPMVNMIKVSHQIFLAIFFLFARFVSGVAGTPHAGCDTLITHPGSHAVGNTCYSKVYALSADGNAKGGYLSIYL